MRAPALLLCCGVLAACPPAAVVKKDPAPVAQARPTSLQALSDDALAALQAGRLDEAKRGFEQVEERAPGKPAVHFNLGLIAERQGDLALAVKRYEQAHAEDPKHRSTLLNLGRAYRAQGRLPDAIALYEQALKDPATEYDADLNNSLSVALRLAKKLPEAEAAARRVLLRSKENPEAYRNLALVAFDQGNYRLAELLCATARKLDDKDPGLYNTLGLVALKLDDRRGAQLAFQKALSLAPDFGPSLFNLGGLALAARDYESAERLLARATAVDSSAEALLAFAWALDGQKARDPAKGLKAGAAFERVLAAQPDRVEASCGAAWAYAADKAGFERAVMHFEKCRAAASPTEQAQIDAKLKALAAQKSGGATPAEAPKPKTGPSGPSLLDRVSDEAAKQAAPDAAH